MTYRDMAEMIEEIVENTEYDYVGIRFEEMVRKIGDACNNSWHNPDREDERDYPVYGHGVELDGTSAWMMGGYSDSFKNHRFYSVMGRSHGADDEIKTDSYGANAYVVAGNKESTHHDADDNEVVIVNAVVIDIIW